MALSTSGGAGGGGRRRGRGRARRQALSEINVTPLVDVMLVLLIIFMISASVMTVGVKVNLPKAQAAALAVKQKPLVVEVHQDNTIKVQDQPVDRAELVAQLKAAAGGDLDQAINIEGDHDASWQQMMDVMGLLSNSGFSKINLIALPAPAEPRSR